MSSEGSVNRPDFCTANLRRSSSMACDLRAADFREVLQLVESLYRNGVASIAVAEKTGHSPDGGDAHAGEPMNLPIGCAAAQPLHHGPSIRHGLKLSRGAQVAEERPAFLGSPEGCDGCTEIALRQGLLAGRDIAMDFHGVPM